MRRVPLILGCCVLVVAGCSGLGGREHVSDVDRHRLRVMLDLPIISDAEHIFGQRPGAVLPADRGWVRGAVTAGLFAAEPAERDSATSPEQVRIKTVHALVRLRDNGWTITSTSCVAPEPDSTEIPEPDQRITDPSQDHWVWNATGYTHVDGVSYWVQLLGEATGDGSGSVAVRVRAPSAADPPDLFPDRPPGLRVRSTCVEQPGNSPAFIEQGTYIEVDARKHSDDPSSDPLRR